MKKIVISAFMVAYALAGFSQTPFPKDTTQVATQAAQATAPVNAVVVEKSALPEAPEAKPTKTVLSPESLKHLLDSSASKGVVIVGYNVIIGNNSNIIVVDDKEQAMRYLALDKSDKFDAPLGKLRLSRHFFERYAIAVKASTMGAGVELATTLSRNFALRVGYNYMAYDYNFSAKVSNSDIKTAIGYDPKLKADGAFKLNHGHALIDFFPFKNGIIHLTGGVYYGETKLDISGQLIDPIGGEPATLATGQTNWPKMAFDKWSIDINGGKLAADIKMANKLKPYAGIGLGRAVPNKRIGAKFELGVLYSGGFKVSQNGQELPDIDDLKNSSDITNGYEQYMKFWPVINFQLIFRLK